MTDPAPVTAGRAGYRSQPRRRGEVLCAAIFDATLAELAEAGYSRLAMERIAARAGASKASLYKRWPGKAELVVAALQHQNLPPEQAPHTGSLRDDVLTILRRAAARLDGVFGQAVRGLMAETLTDPARTATLRPVMFIARDHLMREVLEQAVDRGDIGREVVTPRLIGLAPALVDHHFLIHGAPIPDDVLTGIVDDILLPLLTGARPSASS